MGKLHTPLLTQHRQEPVEAPVDGVFEDLAPEELGEEPGLRLIFMALAAVLCGNALHDRVNVLTAACPRGFLTDLALNLTAHSASFRGITL